MQCLKVAKRKELKASITDMFLKIMGPLYYRMELEMQGVCVFLTSRNNVRPAEFALIKQKMINSRTGWPPIWSGADDQNTILRRPVGRQKRRSKTLLQIQWTLTTSQSQINRSSTSLCLHRIPKQKIRTPPTTHLPTSPLPEILHRQLQQQLLNQTLVPSNKYQRQTKVLKESSTAAQSDYIPFISRQEYYSRYPLDSSLRSFPHPHCRQCI